MGWVMLTEILSLLSENGPMSLKELAVHFRVDLSAMEGMLETLEQKKRISRIETKCAKCKGCVEVKREDAMIFRVT